MTIMTAQRNSIKVTVTEDSDHSAPAVGGRCSPQVSQSNPSTVNSEVVSRQASGANHGVGTLTVGRRTKQDPTGGRKTIELSAMAMSDFNGTDSQNDASPGMDDHLNLPKKPRVIVQLYLRVAINNPI